MQGFTLRSCNGLVQWLKARKEPRTRTQAFQMRYTKNLHSNADGCHQTKAPMTNLRFRSRLRLAGTSRQAKAAAALTGFGGFAYFGMHGPKHSKLQSPQFQRRKPHTRSLPCPAILASDPVLRAEPDAANFVLLQLASGPIGRGAGGGGVLGMNIAYCTTTLFA